MCCDLASFAEGLGSARLRVDMEPVESMVISIGILAWNEATIIGRTIHSLFGQTLFPAARELGTEVEVICVPNGCTDDTAGVARATLAECVAACGSPGVAGRVCEIETAGASNAWNRYVHEFSRPDADYVCLMDADIWFDGARTLASLVDALERNPVAAAAVDVPVKDVALQRRKSLIGRLSLLISGLDASGPPAICGQLYCARAEVLRRIWLPPGVSVGDGFIHRMMITDLLTSPPCYDRVVRVAGASHVFSAYDRWRDVFRHQRAIVIGSTINTFLSGYLRANARSEDAGAYIRRRTLEDPNWAVKVLQEEFARRGAWPIPDIVTGYRFRKLKGSGLGTILRKLPVAAAAFAFDVGMNLAANKALRKGHFALSWEKIRE